MKKFLLSIVLIACCWLSDGQQYLASNHIGGTGIAEVESFTSDEVQNTYISGYFSGNLIHAKQSILSKGNNDIYIAKYNDDQQEEWFVVIGGTGIEQGANIVLAPDGNLLIAGTYSANCQAGTTLGTPQTISMPDGSDGRNIFLAKYNNQTGELMWVKPIIAGKGLQLVTSISVDPSGNILVGGTTAGEAIFTDTQNTLAAGMGFIAKFKADGTYQWNVTYSTVSGNPSIAGIKYQSGNYVYIGSTKYETTLTDRNGDAYKIGPNTDNNGNFYFFAGSIDQNGKNVWINYSMSSKTVAASVLETDADNTMYITGYYDAADFSYDGQPLNLPHSGNDKHSIFLMTLNGNNGDLIGAYSNGSDGVDYPYGLQIKNKLLYICGSLGDQIILPDNRILPKGIFVAAYTINNDKTLTNIDVLEGVKADNSRGIVFSPKSFKLAGSFSSQTPMEIGDSTFINKTPTTKDIYMSKACPIIGIRPTITDVTGCTATSANGKIILDVLGDAGPYTYEWSKVGKGLLKGDNINENEAAQLDTGRYSALVIYNEGYCSKRIENLVIKAPQSLGIQGIQVTDASCSDNNSRGSITVTPFNPTGQPVEYLVEGIVPPSTTPFTIGWQDENVFSGDQVVAARYTVHIRFKGTEQCEITQATLVSDLDQSGYTINAINNVPYTCSPSNNSELIGEVTASTSDARNLDWYAMIDAATGATVQASGATSVNTNEYVFKTVEPGKYKVKGGTFEPHCMQESSALDVLNPPAVVIVSAKPVDILCKGSETGKIIVTATGGKLNPNSTLKYKIVNENNDTYTNTTGKFEHIKGGTYTLTVTDDTPCSATLEGIKVNDLHAGFVLKLESQHDACNGATNGKVNLYVKELDDDGKEKDGALASSYTYILAYEDGSGGLPSNATGKFTNVAPGEYTAMAIEQGFDKCTATYSDDEGIIDVEEMPQVAFSEASGYGITVTNILCNGDPSGKIAVSGMTGGTGSYVVTISKGGNVLGIDSEAPYEISGLSAGEDYLISLADDYGCTTPITHVTTISQPEALKVTVNVTQNVSCPGMPTGALFASASDGNGAKYTYELYDHGVLVRESQESGVFENLLASTNYVVRVTDANDCTKDSDSKQITEPSGLTYTYDKNDVRCYGGNDGSIEITAVATGEKTYFLTDADGRILKDNGTSPIFASLTAGIYKVKILVDGQCGQLTTAIEIGQPELLTITSKNATPAPCNSTGGGTITVTVSGGTAPYVFHAGALTSPAQNDPTYTFTDGVVAGTYPLTVTDKNGCTSAEGSIEVPLSTSPVVIVEQTTLATCSPGNDGAISVTATGVEPFQYSINGGTDYQTDNIFTGLAAGTAYTVTVKAGNNCTTVGDPVTIGRTPDPAKPTIAQTKLATCVPDNNGQITATMPDDDDYEFSIDGTNYQASNIFGTGLTTGQAYSVTVRDLNGCTAVSTTVTIARTPDPKILVTQTQLVSCSPGMDGKVTVVGTARTNGSDVFTYNLPEGENQSNGVFFKLDAIQYTATVTDGNGCAHDSTFTVTKARIPTVTADETNACFNVNNGAITASAVSDGTPTEYVLNGPSMDGDHNATGLFTGLGAGSYTVSSTDTYGCVGTKPGIVINQSSAITADITVKDASSASAKDGSVTVANIQGGVAPYLVTFDDKEYPDVPAGGSLTFNNLIPKPATAPYSLGIYDSNKCLFNTSIVVGYPTGVEDLDPASLKVYPNPSDGHFVIEWTSKKDIKANIMIFNVAGKLIYNDQVQTGVGGVRTTVDISRQAKGTYLLRVPQLEIIVKLVIQ